jgi:hypothetical protein
VLISDDQRSRISVKRGLCLIGSRSLAGVPRLAARAARRQRHCAIPFSG